MCYVCVFIHVCVSKGVKFIHVCVFMLCRVVISTPLFFLDAQRWGHKGREWMDGRGRELMLTEDEIN